MQLERRKSIPVVVGINDTFICVPPVCVWEDGLLSIDVTVSECVQTEGPVQSAEGVRRSDHIVG